MHPYYRRSHCELKVFRAELTVWKGIRHPNILPLLGIVVGKSFLPSLVSPWIEGGSLPNYVALRRANLSLAERLSIVSLP
jgi:serine/threonine protein kinase